MEESYLDLMMSLPHWGFELTLEALTGLLVYPLIRWGHKRLNDRLHRELDAEHGVTHGTPAATRHAVPAPGVGHVAVLGQGADVWVK